MYHYAGNNPVKYTDPTGEWFGFDDVFTGPIDEIVILGAMTFYTTLKIYNSEENKKFSDALLESFDYNLECIKILFVKSDKESEIESAEEQNLVIKDSGKPSLSDMKNKPPTHPDYKPPENWDGRKVKTPDGNGYGWPAKMEIYGNRLIIMVLTHLIGMFNIKTELIHLFIRSN